MKFFVDGVEVPIVPNSIEFREGPPKPRSPRIANVKFKYKDRDGWTWEVEASGFERLVDE